MAILKNKYIIALVLMAVAVFGYRYYASHTKLSEEVFMSYYIELTIAQDSLGSDSVTTKKILTSLNSKYKTSEAQYKSTIAYYNESSERWDKFFTKVVDEVKRRQTKK